MELHTNYVKELRNAIIYLRQNKLVSKMATAMQTTNQTIYNYQHLDESQQALALNALLKISKIPSNDDDAVLQVVKIRAIVALRGIHNGSVNQ